MTAARTQRAAELLEGAAELVAARPGVNVLELRRAAKTVRGDLPRVAAAPPLELVDDQLVAGHRRRKSSS